MAKTATERGRDYVKRMKDAGYVRVYVWTKPKHADTIRQFAGEKNGWVYETTRGKR